MDFSDFLWSLPLKQPQNHHNPLPSPSSYKYLPEHHQVICKSLRLVYPPNLVLSKPFHDWKSHFNLWFSSWSKLLYSINSWFYSLYQTWGLKCNFVGVSRTLQFAINVINSKNLHFTCPIFYFWMIFVIYIMHKNTIRCFHKTHKEDGWKWWWILCILKYICKISQR